MSNSYKKSLTGSRRGHKAKDRKWRRSEESQKLTRRGKDRKGTKSLKIFSETVNVVKGILARLDSPLAWKALCLLRSDNFDGYLDLKCNPNTYKCVNTARDDYLAVSLLKKGKFPRGTVTANPRAAAVETFKAAEAKCAKTNRFIEDLNNGTVASKDATALQAIMLMAQRKISVVLGSFEVDEFLNNLGWGPGATRSTSGRWTSAYQKFKNELTVTPNCIQFGQNFVKSCPAWSGIARFRVIPGDRIAFVNKTAKTDRTIGVPPSMNSFFQKGVGLMMRRRLKRVGVDLSDQTRNQTLAQFASRSGLLATLDLKSASDCISIALVQALLPVEWFLAMAFCRSPHYELDGEIHRYEKFSAMGNGYTFELESLIFWALSTSACEVAGGNTQWVSVYGDDIVVPVVAAELVSQVLQQVGFDLNVTKSFVNGPFRESCGKDYFLGIDIRPVFLKELLSNVESLYKLANSLRRYANRCNLGYGCDQRFRPVWDNLVQRVPWKWRLAISEGYGDGGFVVEHDEFLGPNFCTPHSSRSRKLRERGWEGTLTTQLVLKPVKRLMDEDLAALVTMLYNDESRITVESHTYFRQGFTGQYSEVLQPVERTLKRYANLAKASEKTDKTPTLGYESSRRSTRRSKGELLVHTWIDLGEWC